MGDVTSFGQGALTQALRDPLNIFRLASGNPFDLGTTGGFGAGATFDPTSGGVNIRSIQGQQGIGTLDEVLGRAGFNTAAPGFLGLQGRFADQLGVLQQDPRNTGAIRDIIMAGGNPFELQQMFGGVAGPGTPQGDPRGLAAIISSVLTGGGGSGSVTDISQSPIFNLLLGNPNSSFVQAPDAARNAYLNSLVQGIGGLGLGPPDTTGPTTSLPVTPTGTQAAAGGMANPTMKAETQMSPINPGRVLQGVLRGVR